MSGWLRWTLVVVGLSASTSLVPARARARDLTVTVVGCRTTIEPSLRHALALELNGSFRILDASAVSPGTEGPIHIRVGVVHCDAESWMVRLSSPSGQPLFGPERLFLGGQSRASRARIAALWIAERLAYALPRSPRRDDTDAPIASDPLDLRLTVSAGGAVAFDPAVRIDPVATVRFGLSTRFAPFFIGAAELEGGALVSPFNHGQPVVRLCIVPQVPVRLGSRLEFGIGARGCASISRDLGGASDLWTAGGAVGLMIRLSLAVDESWDVGVRLDGDAWYRTLTEQVLATRLDMPWVGLLALSLEARVRMD